jgi:RNA polymerase sigma-70 factor, ECF subfamily
VNASNGPAPHREARFTQLFASTYGPVFGYVRRRTGPEAAEDIVAEVYCTAWRHLNSAPEQPLPWLYRIAWHAIGNQRRGVARRQRLQERVQAMAGSVRSADHADEIADREALAVAFGALTEPDREVLRLISWEGLQPADAARVLGCSSTALRVRLHRARRRLADLIQDTTIPRGGRRVPVTSRRNR